jgi:hypothetical protein
MGPATPGSAVVGSAAPGHAKGMPAISRRLSVATPPEPVQNTMHPNGMTARSGHVMASLDSWLASVQDATSDGRILVMSLTLDNRLMAAMPPASDPSHR